ncbi:MAG TPA: phospholipid carrier-dependent glycosyltransferase [Candidatus Dormibacteraeota bacterium]|nr:phospholipid carrier-dependent glycosyltransferase [Candidatus Dormibacteraeota bacterium]
MSGPRTSQPDRVVSRASESTGRRSGALAGLLVGGLALRVIIAYLLPGSGFGVDINAFAYWASDLAQHGAWGFYDRPFFHDYTPGYLYVLWLLGYVGQLLGGLGDLVKAPAIVSDLALAYLVHELVLELGGDARRALLAASLVLFIPVTWFDSAVWGQVDSFGMIFVLLALRATWRDQPERAAVYGTIAAIVKPQLGIVIPIVAAVVIRRAWSRRGSEVARPVGVSVAAGGDRADGALIQDGPDGRAGVAWRSTGTLGLLVGGLGWWRRATEPIRRWSERERGPVRILTTAIVGLVTATIVCLPFRLTIVGLVVQVVSTATGYPYVTVNAYNPWALLTQAGQGLAATGTWLCDVTAPGRCAAGGATVGPLPALMVGSVLILAVTIAVAVLVARSPDRLTILVGLAVLAVAFFVVPTRVHERYLYPFVIVGTILAAISRRWLVAYVALALADFLNLYVVLTTLYKNPGVSDWLGIGGAIRSYWGVAIIAAVHLAGFLWVAGQLRDARRATLAEELAAASEPELPAGAEPPRVSDPGRFAPGSVARATAGSAVSATAAATGPATAPWRGGASLAASSAHAEAWDDELPPAGPGSSGRNAPTGDTLVDRLPPWLRLRSIRPDRSAALAGESGGRFDRLDLWSLIVLLVATSIFRGFRLAEPYQMHFDEVYHARTATEFLQKWRYGIDHAIYEYTHPHLAKYAMAAGLVAFGGDHVAETSRLGLPVRDSTIEPRWDDPRLPGGRAGDRLYIATGTDVRVYDLLTRAPLATIAAPRAVALAVDTAGHRLLIGTSDGAILSLDTSSTLDELRRAGTSNDTIQPRPFATVGGAVTRLLATSDGTAIAAASAGRLTMLDGSTGAVRGTRDVAGLGGLAEAGSSDGLVARPSEVPDAAAAASALAAVVGGDTGTYESRLKDGGGVVTMPVTVTASNKPNLQSAITDGRLAGFSVEAQPRVAAAGSSGVTLVRTGDASVVTSIALDAAATDVVSVTGVDDPAVYAAAGSKVAVLRVGGSSAASPRLDTTIQMPAPVSRILFDASSRMVHVLGQRQDGSGQTVYVIEPHGNAVFADAPLPGTAAAWAMDQSPDHPSADRQQLLVLSADGAAWSVDIGGHAYAWRIPGVIAGILTVLLLYLLARVLFARRAVAVAFGLILAIDPMLFVQSRIGMNDVYAGLFIVAAITLFALIWTDRWRWRGAFWLAMPVVGVLLGLGLSSKWVGAYAIGAVGLLYLARSALGRIVLLLGLVAVTAVLGYIGVSVPGGTTGGGNLTFMLVMIGLTVLAFVVSALRPVRWSDEEVLFAVGAPIFAGGVAFLGLLLAGKLGATMTVAKAQVPLVAIAFGLVALGGLVYLAFLAAGRFGVGPAAPPRHPDDPASLLPPPAPPPPAWLRPGWLFGLPLLWVIGSVVVLPVVVYVIVYIPWAFVDGHRLWADLSVPLIGKVPSWPPGHDGQTLIDLTASMYNYHDTLRATHPASSPWWAWPFDLKPVWFYQGSFASSMAGAIYDHGSLVTWWLAIPAMAFVAFQAFRRRSLALALVAIVFASMWIPWARIDRATFQYHWYSSLPFILLALAYLIAELWHGPSARVWLLARVAAAAAVMGPVVLWLFKAPLCALAGVSKVYPNSPACVGNPGQLVVTARVGALAVIAIVAAVVLLWQLLRLARPGRASTTSTVDAAASLGITAAIAVIAIVAAGALLPDSPFLSIPGIPSELLALLLAIPLGGVAWIALTARDPRRFAVGIVVAAVAWTVVLYPNIAAVPMPNTVYNAYQGILPTYLYPFQFAVNTEAPVSPPSLLSAEPAILFGAILLTSLLVAYSAWVWRLTLAERAATSRSTVDGASVGRA